MKGAKYFIRYYRPDQKTISGTEGKLTTNYFKKLPDKMYFDRYGYGYVTRLTGIGMALVPVRYIKSGRQYKKRKK